LIGADKWDDISALCAQAVAALQGFSFAHLGLNQTDAMEAAATADILGKLGLPVKDGNSSSSPGAPSK